MFVNFSAWARSWLVRCAVWIHRGGEKDSEKSRVVAVTALRRSTFVPTALRKLTEKGLRFHLIEVAGKVVSHARRRFLKITEGRIDYREARSQLVEFSSA
jgi:hypothetical protein